MSCAECKAETIWDDQVGSAICLSCGTLVDPSQSVLASHLEVVDTSARQFNHLWDPSASSTLKSIHGRNTWDLAGQGRDARDRKNTYAMHQFIKAVSSSLSVPALSPRAITLFSQAMSKGKYRWGRKVKLIGGAALAIALRESHRADSLRDIAFVMDEAYKSLSRSFSDVVSLLRLSLPPVDPAQHFPGLQSYLDTLLHPFQSPSPIQEPLRKTIISLRLSDVTRTATSISELLTRQGPSLPINSLPTIPTACAILLLSLESETRDTLPNIGYLAHLLGQRYGVSKVVIMGRYKFVQDLVEDWIRNVPWLEQFESKRTGCGRSKIAKRAIVARGLKDVVQFKEEIWRKKLETLDKPSVTIELDDISDCDSDSYLETTTYTPSRYQRESEADGYPRKKRKTQCALDIASQFLLDPLSGSAAVSIAVPSSSSLPNILSGVSTVPPLPLTSYLLSASSPSLSSCTHPTRLQLLTAERGGSGETEILDDELFDEGELDGMVRSPQDAGELLRILGWEKGAHFEASEMREISSSRLKEIDRDTGRTPRIDMDAFAKVLGGAVDL